MYLSLISMGGKLVDGEVQVHQLENFCTTRENWNKITDPTLGGGEYR